MAKYKLYPYQESGVSKTLEMKRCINGDEMGLGKEQPYSEPVLTPHGWVRMGDLKVGDEVIAADGTATVITNIYEQGVKDVYRVTFSDGKIIAESKAKYTFVETIRRIGLMRVRNLGIKFCGVPIVSTTIDKKYGYAQVPVENGLYIMTHSSTKDKKIQLDRIAKELGLKLKVEII